MSESEEKTLKSNGGATRGGVVAAAKNAARFIVKSNTSKATAVQVWDNSLKNAKGNSLTAMRLDRPHTGAQFNHINVHRSLAKKIPNHTRITPAQLKAGQVVGKVAEVANTISKPLVVAAAVVDTVRIGMSIAEDAEKNTTRNTVAKVATVAGGWGGGASGAMAGAAIGSAIFPVFGTMIGGMIGGIAGGIGGSVGAEKAVDAIGDKCNYNIEWIVCTHCENKFERKTYITGRIQICPNCQALETIEAHEHL